MRKRKRNDWEKKESNKCDVGRKEDGEEKEGRKVRWGGREKGVGLGWGGGGEVGREKRGLGSLALCFASPP